MSSRQVFEVVPESLCRERTGKPPIRLKWVDTDKGGAGTPYVRSRLVAREIKRAKSPEEALDVHELYTSMPPVEAVRVIMSVLVTKRVSASGSPLKVGLWEISRAHLYGEALNARARKGCHPEGPGIWKPKKGRAMAES